ncbi:MAG TPA: hypothetical protein DE045_04725 [Oceanospirillaceae bacterium]|nr:hypothetical protein [Oceanospirillaceae bacterium]
MKAMNWQHALCALGFVGLLLSSNAQAIALGNIKVNSTHLQPLQLQVELVELHGVLADSMTAKVAGPAQFTAADLVYHAWYSSLAVDVVSDGADIALQVVGTQPVQQRELELIFEVDYLGGRLLAEYSVALPDFVAQVTKATVATITPVAQPEVKVAEPVLQPSEPVVQAPESAPEPIKPQLITVGPGQTLWRIAVNNTPAGLSPWQSLLAFYSINPTAFKGGDIRNVMAGRQLNLPTNEQFTVLTARQAKTAYDLLVKPRAKSSPKTVPVANDPLQDQVQQQKQAQQQLQQQVETQQQQVTQLASQSQQLEAQLADLQTDNQSAALAQQVLQQENQNLAQGVAAQQQDLVGLNEQRTSLENNMLSLDQKFEATQMSLNQAQAELLQVQQSLLQTRQATESAQATQVSGFGLQNTYTIMALLLMPVLLIMGLVWWLVSRGRGAAKPQPIEPAVVDKAPLSLDPLAEYDSKPSAKVADLQTSALQMQGMPERSFIEQLLQEQDQAELDSVSRERAQPATLEDDHVHLSKDIEALLNQRHQPQEGADEPVDYLSLEEDMNTKLDLARSYRDMGQISDAHAVLDQVRKFGNTDQQAQATLLLSRLK